MPGGRIDPTGDRPQRFHALLVEWRKAAGLSPVVLTESAPAPAKAPEPALTAVGWRLVSLGNEAVPAETGGRPIELRFTADGKVQGSAGCNRVSGAYTLAGESLRFGPLMTTKMACPAMELERRFLEALQSTARWRIASGALELLDASGKPLARSWGQPCKN